MTVQISPAELRAQLVSFARKIGFHSCRIAACGGPAHAAQFREWLHEGAHGEMNYMERGEEKRCDPQKVLPGARSIVVLALNYFQGEQAPRRSATAATGKIARYAWGDDYHEVVGSKLSSLLAWIKKEIPQAEGKVCVDIQPVMDKAWAARAGLGWIGKHTNLITPEYGSWVFIGELLLSIELAYDDELVADDPVPTDFAPPAP